MSYHKIPLTSLKPQRILDPRLHYKNVHGFEQSKQLKLGLKLF